MTIDEIDENYQKFNTSWRVQLSQSQTDLSLEQEIFKFSYRRIVTLNAWRTIILEPTISISSLSFFLEAQNDALVSHTLAQLGSWRSALQALRSCIENTVSCLYYKDHSIELKLWELGKHRLGFTEGVNYLKNHPEFRDFSDSITGIELLVKEYAQLSKAVHSSAVTFRMTNNQVSTKLWSSERAQLGGWKTREQSTLRCLNTILLVMFKNELSGTKHSNLREVIKISIPFSNYASIRSSYKVNLM